MNLNSLGFRSQLIFTSFDGKAEDRGSYWAIHTLSNPNFFWGNLLIFDRAPRSGDFKEWTKLFKQEFNDPRIYHVTFAWDSPTGDIGDVSEFLHHGFRLEATAVLAARTVVRPPKFNDALEVRALRTDAEWEQMIEIQISSAHDHLSRTEWESFYRKQALRYRKMEDAGFGGWYGGFLNDELVGGLGIFHRNGVGRFQTVSTAPQFQRRGICQTLVFRSSQMLLSSGQVEHLVMCADPDYHAIKIYESVGFQRQITEHGVYWWDKTRNP